MDVGAGSLKILAGVLVHRAARPLRGSVSCGSGWSVPCVSIQLTLSQASKLSGHISLPLRPLFPNRLVTGVLGCACLGTCVFRLTSLLACRDLGSERYLDEESRIHVS